jgi:hypothetical protein
MIDLHQLDRNRLARTEIRLYGTVGDDKNGLFAFKSPVDGRELHIIASSGFGWEHVSVSKKAKPPSWAEMEWVKRKFFKPDEVCMQLHVAEVDHISAHPNCLHIWRPLDAAIPLPPKEFVA